MYAEMKSHAYLCIYDCLPVPLHVISEQLRIYSLSLSFRSFDCFPQILNLSNYTFSLKGVVNPQICYLLIVAVPSDSTFIFLWLSCVIW